MYPNSVAVRLRIRRDTKSVNIAPANNIVYADESGTSEKEKCYTIGALLVPESEHAKIEYDIKGLVAQHGIVGEVKWTKVSTSHGLINFSIDILKRILQSNCCFNAIVVKKDVYVKWQGNKEEAFYTTYTQLLKHCASIHRKPTRVLIDNRSDTYDKQDEVAGIIANRMLAKLSSAGKILNVSKVDSRDHVLLQTADLLTGALNTAHHKFLNPDWSFHRGKALCITRLAAILGWDALFYDTFPSINFNVWHFPIEFRAKPKSRNVVPNLNVSFVTADELQEQLSHSQS